MLGNQSCLKFTNRDFKSYYYFVIRDSIDMVCFLIFHYSWRIPEFNIRVTIHEDLVRVQINHLSPLSWGSIHNYNNLKERNALFVLRAPLSGAVTLSESVRMCQKYIRPALFTLFMFMYPTFMPCYIDTVTILSVQEVLIHFILGDMTSWTNFGRHRSRCLFTSVVSFRISFRRKNPRHSSW